MGAENSIKKREYKKPHKKETLHNEIAKRKEKEIPYQNPNFVDIVSFASPAISSDISLCLKQYNPLLIEEDTPVESILQIIIQGLTEPISNARLIYCFALKLRKLVVNNPDSPKIFEIANKLGLLKKVVSLLSSGNIDILLEATWILTNYASIQGSAKYLIEMGTLSSLLQLFQMDNERISESVLQVLVNIASDGDEFRDILIFKTPLITILVSILSQKKLMTGYLRAGCWVINILTCSASNSSYDILKVFIPLLNNIIFITDKSCLVDSLCTIANLTSCAPEKISDIIHAMEVKRIVKFLSSEEIALQTPALRIFGNMAVGSEDDARKIIDVGVLTEIYKILMNTTTSPGIFTECLWIISNLACGPPNHIQELINERILNKLSAVTTNFEDAVIKKEALWGIVNSTSQANKYQIMRMVDMGYIQAITTNLNALKQSHSLLCAMLDAMQKILETGKELGEPYFEVIIHTFDLLRASSVIKSLQLIHNKEVYRRINVILKYLVNEEVTTIGLLKKR